MIYTSKSDIELLCSCLDNPSICKISTTEANLYKQSKLITKKYYGNEVFIRGIIEFSNVCCQNCYYCGLRKENTNIERYRLTKDTILHTVDSIYQDGIRSVVLQSGEDKFFTRKTLCSIVSSIHKKYPKMAITLSIGERSFETYRALYLSGANRYLIKHETCQPNVYKKLHPGHTLFERLYSQNIIKKSGFILGSGFLVGLPGVSTKDIVSEFHFLEQKKYDMWGIGVFIPSSNTPLEMLPHGSLSKTLKAMILSRLFYGPTMIPITTAFHSIAGEDMTSFALEYCANVFMINYTPKSKQPLYNIYNGKQNMPLSKVLSLIKKVGKKPSFTKGDPYHGNH